MNGNGADMLFYENSQGYHFHSLQSLYGQKPYQTYKFDPKNISDDMNQKVSNALDFEVLDNFDTLGAIANGTFGNKVITFDPLLRRKNSQDVTFNYADYFKKSKSLNKYAVTNDYKNRLGATMYGDPPTTVAGLETSTLRMASSNKEQKLDPFVAQNPDAVANDIMIEEYLPNRVAQMALANYMRIRLTIAGDPSIVAGHTVVFNNYRTSPTTFSDGGSNAKRELDPFYSGKYLVSAVRHIVKNNGYITVVELCKESVGLSYPSFDSSNSTLKKLVDGGQS
jgi:hypothetical protein